MTGWCHNYYFCSAIKSPYGTIISFSHYFFFRDISPMGSTLEETNKYLDEMTDLALELQQQTGVKLLWATCNLFAHPTYACGASTNPDAHIFAMAAAQVKKGLEIAKKLGAEGFGN